jgi:hypothetical protein
MGFFMTKRKDGRFTVSPLGEFYEDFLIVDAWINNRTTATQANSLLCAKLMQRQTEIRDRVEYLAEKRSISTKEMWAQILDGTAQRKSSDEDGEAQEQAND